MCKISSHKAASTRAAHNQPALYKAVSSAEPVLPVSTGPEGMETTPHPARQCNCLSDTSTHPGRQMSAGAAINHRPTRFTRDLLCERRVRRVPPYVPGLPEATALTPGHCPSARSSVGDGRALIAPGSARLASPTPSGASPLPRSRGLGYTRVPSTSRLLRAASAHPTRAERRPKVVLAGPMPRPQ